MTEKPKREMTRAEWLAHVANQPDDIDDGPTWDEVLSELTPEARNALTDKRPRDEWGFLLPAPATDAHGQSTTEFRPTSPHNTADVMAPLADQTALVAGAAPAATTLQYVTLQQVATYLKRNKDQVRRDINADPDAPRPAVEGPNGTRHEWVWSELLLWLEAKYKRKLPERFPSLS